jgi:hypothetical protein
VHGHDAAGAAQRRQHEVGRVEDVEPAGEQLDRRQLARAHASCSAARRHRPGPDLDAGGHASRRGRAA